MAAQIEIFVEGKAVRIYRGMRVKHALLAYDYSLYKEAGEGGLLIEDENGFRLDMEGALHHGAKIFVKRSPD